MVGRRAALGAVLALLLAPAVAPVAARASGVVEGQGLSGQVLEGFCTDLAGIVATENAHERDDFARTAVEAMQVARAELDKRMARSAALVDINDEVGAPPLTWERGDALAAARDLWQRWMPVAPADSLVVAEDRPDAWLVAPAPSPEPVYTGEPIRVDKADGRVTWHLPHPSERERLYRAVCGPPGPGG